MDIQEETVQVSLITQQQVAVVKAELAQQMRREMTPTEERLWKCLRGGRVGAHFRRQQIVDGFIADFYCHHACLVVEVDGAVHKCQEQQAYDAERDRIF